ncbi:MAG: thioredoxin-disulfide reductase [Candidatus Thorarchaeota archaeon]|nr:thioredoxin-disulfide reductase [Candidatus Thorarchaeota archaeon]
MSEDLDWELVIIGGGPAGMTAAIYGARYGLKTLLLESKVLGGAQATSPGIENYPGYTFIVGIDLATKMKEQVKKCGAIIKEITDVRSIQREGDNGDFLLDTRRGVYRAKAIIIATGGGHKHLGVPGEEEFTGRGVSFCATCDGPLFRDKTVAVVGGGNTAVTEALYLAEVTGKVYLIHRRDELRAEKVVQDYLFNSNVEIIWDSVVKEIKGNNLVNEMILENVKTGEQRSLTTDGTFIALGSRPESALAKSIGVETNERGEIIVNAKQATSITGVFAAGDVVESMKQIAVAVGHGAIAADSAYSYIRKIQRGPIGYA